MRFTLLNALLNKGPTTLLTVLVEARNRKHRY